MATVAEPECDGVVYVYCKQQQLDAHRDDPELAPLWENVAKRLQEHKAACDVKTFFHRRLIASLMPLYKAVEKWGPDF